MQRVNRLWNQVLLVKKYQTQKYHPWAILLLVIKCHTSKHQQQTHQNAKKNRKKSTYQRIRSHTQVRQNHHSSEYDSSNGSKYKRKICDKNKNHQKRKKQSSSDSSLSDSDSSDEIGYKIKRCNKKKKHRKNKQGPIKLCAKVTAKLLTSAYKSKVLKFKLDEDPHLLQHCISFINFMESLNMIFSQYKETCEVLLDYPTIGGEDIKYYVKRAIRNLLHANIDYHSKRLISELPVNRVKCISKLQSHCANMTFSEKM